MTLEEILKEFEDSKFRSTDEYTEFILRNYDKYIINIITKAFNAGKESRGRIFTEDEQLKVIKDIKKATAKEIIEMIDSGDYEVSGAWIIKKEIRDKYLK